MEAEPEARMEPEPRAAVELDRQPRLLPNKSNSSSFHLTVAEAARRWGPPQHSMMRSGGSGFEERLQ